MVTHVVVVTCQDCGREALYVGGELQLEDSTIYARDIAEYAGDEPVEFSHVVVTTPANMSRYPSHLEQCLIWATNSQSE